jgi:hypothetical protein
MARIEQRASGARMSNVQRYWRGKDWPAQPAGVERGAWALWREHVRGSTYLDLARREGVPVGRMKDLIWRVEAAVYGEQHPEQFPAREGA